MVTTVYDRVAAVSDMLRTVPTTPAGSGPLPDGPRWPAIVQSIGLLAFRERLVPYLDRRYGSPFTLRLLPRNRSMVFFHDPDAIREIFTGDPEVFHAGKGNAILGPLMGEHSLLLVDSAQHKRARRMLMPAFSHSAIDGYREMVHEIARDHVRSWPAGTPFSALEAMNEITLDIILKVVFGVTDDDHLDEMRPLVRDIIQINPVILLGYSMERIHRLKPWRDAAAKQDRLDAAIYAQIARRRAAAEDDGGVDVLAQLLRIHDEDGSTLTDVELRDQLVTLLMAGHETTATALAWTLQEIGSDPVLVERATQAADSGDDDYLEAAMKEAMRVHPVIAFIARLLMEPTTIAGCDLPAGTYVSGSIILAHKREASHPEAATFRPERFLEGEVHPNTWIPFGGGVRRCIGAGFSMMEGVAVLREILEVYSISAVGPERTVVRNITAVPKNGAQIVVTPR
ncbi:putative cytochrome P450 135A1 [Nocardioides baekrokdamisoli]|uniref:Putative cytochrome P450 135A1 n=1 Tax=Nocardioides baekrokdamisoli TaxID=1804624 RepID=A0A3G9IRB3_9ACTN|nr:cytochrome P450 [Nocardioides baekrokdamisoli]BBH16171.1 putative cytochrome P450 135A1 [Nocardioides baekrokdamisoli]